MVETAINTGLRWGELIAIKPRHVDLIKRTLRVEETVVEVSIKDSPNGARMLTKPYPKDNEARTMALPEDLVDQLTEWITTRRLGPDDLLFATRYGTAISRNTFRARVWLPATRASGVDVRVHDLRHAHASWLLAGDADLRSVMDRMGHAQISTTQKYLHALPNADAKNLNALNKTRRRHGSAGSAEHSDTSPPRTITATTRRTSSRHSTWPIPPRMTQRNLLKRREPSESIAAGEPPTTHYLLPGAIATHAEWPRSRPDITERP